MSESKLPTMDSIVKPILYILMRNDLNSMNAGKAIAQGSHATSLFLQHAEKLEHESLSCNEELSNDNIDLINAINAWKIETYQGFGTVLVLTVDEIELMRTINIANDRKYMNGIVHDPTYPILDGRCVHYIPLNTCGFIFVPDKNNPNIKHLLSNFSLYP